MDPSVRHRRLRSLAALAAAAVMAGAALSGCGSDPAAGTAYTVVAQPAEVVIPATRPATTTSTRPRTTTSTTSAVAAWPPKPWDPERGLCRTFLIGDSLVAAAYQAYVDAMVQLGCETIVDGVAARSLSDGWQCTVGNGESAYIKMMDAPQPGNRSCRPSGLELLRLWPVVSNSASVVVVALGTNDAGMRNEDSWLTRWKAAAALTSGPLVFATGAARPGSEWVAKTTRYNSALRAWCRTEPRCVIADWASTAAALDPASYVDHVHLTGQAGLARAVFLARSAVLVAVPAPPAPARWQAPALALPPGTTTPPTVPPAPTTPPTIPPPPTTAPPATSPTTTMPPVTTVPPTTSPTTTIPPSTTTTTTTTTTAPPTPSA